MKLLWLAEKYKQLTMYVSLQVMSDFADAMLEIASRSQIVPASIQAAVITSLELVEESTIQPSEDHKSG
jgi:predicted lipid-binding transport protein (Tim44 family)